MEKNKIEDVIIIWSWPAGHTAAIYLARAGLRPLMFEWFYAWGVAAWGQLTTTTEVENFPWFPNGISGPKLMEDIRSQSINNWVTIITQTVDKADLSRNNKDNTLLVRSNNEIYSTKSLIIATGATAKKLDIPWVDEYWMKGISGCAVCDGSLPLFRNKVLAVVWGGDVAMEEAMHLSKFGSQVLIIHRRDSFRASKSMQERVMTNEKIKIIRDTQVKTVYGDGNSITWLKLLENNGKEYTLEVGGLFFAIWHTPNTGFLNGQIGLDETGYILLQRNENYNTSTTAEGVFAAGDVADKVYRQAITSAGTWCMAALDCEKWLQSKR